MEIGKLPTKTLEEIILNPINNLKFKRSEIVVRPKTGEDCSAVDLNNELLVISTDPITGAEKNSGYIAVHINCNDAASSGAEPIGILLTVLMPPTSTKETLTEIMNGAYKAANELKIEILGGHTEVTDAVNKPIISGTVIAKSNNRKFISSSGAKIGQDVIMTKWAGIEGTSIIAHDYEEIIKNYISEDCIENAKTFGKMLSVVPEGLICANNGATCMHDITEGGIFGAAWEIADCSNTGIEIYIDKIPIMPETSILCRLAHINPYRLISSGSLLITAFNGEELVKILGQKDIKATVIGKITQSEKHIVYPDGTFKNLTEPERDEIYNVKF